MYCPNGSNEPTSPKGIRFGTRKERERKKEGRMKSPLDLRSFVGNYNGGTYIIRKKLKLSHCLVFYAITSMEDTFVL
jgi:hypothetical protein